MKQLIVAAILCLSTGVMVAQEQDWKAMQETAKTFVRQGDYSNAVMVLNRAIEKESNNLELKKDLAFAYYLNRDYVRALETAKPFPERQDADVQSFQILGMVYKAIEEAKDAEKMYRIALKKFPNSGVLYSEYGEMLWSKKSYKEAIQQWEKGIEVDPNHSGNYYNAAKYYFFTKDKIWALVYGEIFINLESYSKRTPEIKTILLDAYKKLFTDGDLAKGQDSKNDFVRGYLDVMNSQSGYVAANGVTPETLSAIRTKFVISWFEKYSKGAPFRLFEYHQQLLKAGMFEAYNQWVFGTAGNLPAYESWTKTHAEEYKKFNDFQHSRVFKLPTGQYYQTANK
jgi:tetratricopeptide (TPR) repeat protein